MALFIYNYNTHAEHTGNKPIKTKGKIKLQQDCVTTLMQANQEN